MIKNTTTSFGIIAKCLHWGMALLILIQFTLAYTMMGLDPNPFKWTLYDLHKAIGLIVLILVGLRLGWRLINPVPTLPRFLPKWQILSSHLIIIMLYLLMFLMPLSGLGMNLLNGYSVSYFGLFTIPKIYPNPTSFGSLFYQLHIFSSYILLVCLSAHIGAALYHHFILKDWIFTRMLIIFKK